MVNTVNYTKVSPGSAGYGVPSTDIASELLLQTGDLVLLQNGSDNLLFESGGIRSTNFATSAVGSALNYGEILLKFLLLQNTITDEYLLLQDNVSRLALEDIEGKSTNFAKESPNSTNYTTV